MRLEMNRLDLQSFDSGSDTVCGITNIVIHVGSCIVIILSLV